MVLLKNDTKFGYGHGIPNCTPVFHIHVAQHPLPDSHILMFTAFPSQPKYLQKSNLQFVTSSVQEKAKDPSPDQKHERMPHDGQNMTTGTLVRPCNDQESMCVANAQPEGKKEKESGQGINPFAAYHVAASAASYLQSRAMGVLPFRSGNGCKSDPTIKAIVNGEHAECLTIDEASFVATTNSVTSMVAAKEETKQAVADDLNSSRSCPCEWFICDDNQSSTRYFVVQVKLRKIT